MTRRPALVVTGGSTEQRAPTSSSAWDDMVAVGRIIRPHGHKGAVVVAPESDFAADRFRPGSELQWMRNGAMGVARIGSSRPFQDRWVVTIDGIDTMNDAETLRGLDLRVPPDALHPLEPGTHYVHDLEGCEVETAGGEPVGRVTGVQFGSAAPLLMVASAGGEVLIPLVEGICRVVDPAAKRIVIDPPAGLIEVNRADAMKS